jgi:hypothetical protein
MPWIPREIPIYQVLDNLGGQGIRASIEEYTNRLRNEHNIIMKFQAAKSPELNALDLGIWMSLKSAIESRHQNRRQDIIALATTAQEAWKNTPADSIQWVYNKIPIVHQLIVESKGDNITMEERRGTSPSFCGRVV